MDHAWSKSLTVAGLRDGGCEGQGPRTAAITGLQLQLNAEQTRRECLSDRQMNILYSADCA